MTCRHRKAIHLDGSSYLRLARLLVPSGDYLYLESWCPTCGSIRVCAVCCRPAPGGISYTLAGKRHELCDMHPGMANHDVARIIALRAANVRLMRELHRHQTGTQIEGDYVEHWISRSDFEELERRCDDMEQRLSTIADEAFGPFPVQSAEENMTAIERGIFELRQTCDRLRAELNRRPRVGDRVRVTIDIVQREGIVRHVSEDRVHVQFDDAREMRTHVTNIEVML